MPAESSLDRRMPARTTAIVLLLSALAFAGLLGCTTTNGQDGAVDVRIGSSEPLKWDPALAGDAGSASVLAQVFEGVTAFDAESRVQPALADSWQADEDGRRISFHLRSGLAYSDGTPILAQHIVDSWLRLIDPVRPSPLSSLLADVVGAVDYQAGRIDRGEVGLRAEGEQVIVELRRPATYFLSVTASPSLAVVPPQMYGLLEQAPPASIVVSGAYLPSVPAAGVIRLEANERYWAGVPPLHTVELVTDFGGRSGVDVFRAGEVDYTGIGAFDASWIKYDQELGPRLRQTESFSLSYYGFNTRSAPFDDADVRLAFAKAVEWDRIVTLGQAVPATSMIPPGVPGRDELDHRPAYDPDAARQLLADAGYEGGEGFPTVTLATFGVGFEQTVATELEQNLGVDVNIEVHDFPVYLAPGGEAGQADIWTLSWIADYPHAHDFLGLLLETGSTSNEGGWSNTEYDALIEQAAATDDAEEQAGFYAQAQEVLAREAPVVPVAYGQSWELSRDGLLGALESGVGFIRVAGLDWAEGSGR